MLVWRNGRRTGLKIPRGQLHVGSTPTTSTKKIIRSSNYFFVLLFFIFSFFTLILVGGILSPAGHQTPVGARPRTSRSRLWLKTSTPACFFNASPREGNFMWVRPPPPAPSRLSTKSFSKPLKTTIYSIKLRKKTIYGISPKFEIRLHIRSFIFCPLSV